MKMPGILIVAPATFSDTRQVISESGQRQLGILLHGASDWSLEN